MEQRYFNFENTKKDDKSPLYEFSNPLIAVGGVWRPNLEKMPYDRFLPFNFCLVQNNSANRIRVIVNDTIRRLIPSGVIQTFDAESIPAIWGIQVVNLGVAQIAADDIQLTFQKVENIKPMAVKLFGGGI